MSSSVTRHRTLGGERPSWGRVVGQAGSSLISGLIPAVVGSVCAMTIATVVLALAVVHEAAGAPQVKDHVHVPLIASLAIYGLLPYLVARATAMTAIAPLDLGDNTVRAVFKVLAGMVAGVGLPLLVVALVWLPVSGLVLVHLDPGRSAVLAAALLASIIAAGPMMLAAGLVVGSTHGGLRRFLRWRKKLRSGQ